MFEKIIWFSFLGALPILLFFGMAVNDLFELVINEQEDRFQPFFRHWEHRQKD